MMGQSNFAGGFFLGALVGGVLGGVVGALATSRLNQQEDASDLDFGELSDELKRNLSNVTQEERMELARRGLEDKIAQLNSAIEDVRLQMANGHAEPLADPVSGTTRHPIEE
ncbi:MAG: gas vesicle protein [Cyanobacteria bacterium P01_D01_bin.14]